MSDLFHEDVPIEFINKVFAVMAASPQHTYQVLTKRPERMWEYLAGDRGNNPGQHSRQAWINLTAYELHLNRLFTDERWLDSGPCDWPLPNVWLGTSAENQEQADKRIPSLVQMPAALRFVSLEPLLGPIDLKPKWLERLDWVIVGGESGPKARPCNLKWILDIVQQCKAAGVPCFVKQLGTQAVTSNLNIWRPYGEYPAGAHIPLKHPKGGDPSEWPEELRVQENPEVTR